jgi:hypothetical protein
VRSKRFGHCARRRVGHSAAACDRACAKDVYQEGVTHGAQTPSGRRRLLTVMTVACVIAGFLAAPAALAGPAAAAHSPARHSPAKSASAARSARAAATADYQPACNGAQVRVEVGGKGTDCNNKTAPLKGVVFADSKSFSWTAKSDAKTGAYAFWGPQGSYSLIASANGWIPQSSSVSIKQGKSITSDFTVRPTSC